MSVRMRLSREPGGTVEENQAEALGEALQGWDREPGSFAMMYEADATSV